jgi:hypothetical protein
MPGGVLSPQLITVGITTPVKLALPPAGYIENVGSYTVYLSPGDASVTAGVADQKRKVVLAPGAIVNFKGMDTACDYYAIAETAASTLGIVAVV